MTHSPQSLLDTIAEEGVTSFFGVPDSTLNGFGHLILQPQSRTFGVVCSNEGSAVAEAIGYFLASGKPACVYMQNSGLANALNPLSSLAHEDVFGTPMLLLIGWRGYPDIPDEPQHVVMGKSTIPLLETMNIPTYIMRRDGIREVSEAAQHASRANGPVALLVPPKVVGPLDAAGAKQRTPRVAPIEFVRAAIHGASEETVYFGATGFTARLLMACADQGDLDESQVFPLVGGMGHTFAVAARFALSRSDLDVVCLDGDGSLLMHTGALARVADLSHTRLFHILLNNGSHQSVGGHPTIAPKCDFASVARSFGFRNVFRCSSPRELSETLLKARVLQSAAFMEVLTDPDPSMKLPRPSSTPEQMMRNFRIKVHKDG